MSLMPTKGINTPPSPHSTASEGSDTAVFSGAYSLYTVSVTGSIVSVFSLAAGQDVVLGVEQFQLADQAIAVACV